ncbi:MAG: phosphoribosyltransferase [Sedimentibacter sp.]|jgi:ComF family protein|nr:phosphoribosyltransferase [Sedimentibacter sp.]
MKAYVESLLELLYPEKNTCFFCETHDEEINDRYICQDCKRTMKKIVPPICIKCSKPIDMNAPDELCSDCRKNDHSFEMSRSVYAYEGSVKKGIYMFKYYNKPYFYRFFGKCLVDCMKNNEYNKFDMVVPVPLHRSKLRIRGYNQSSLLAKYISRNTDIPYGDVLKRIKKTPKQSQMTKEERRKNLKEAFDVKGSKIESLTGKTVLLVDDVYTTGSTADECSKTLLKNGASKIYVMTIAR